PRASGSPPTMPAGSRNSAARHDRSFARWRRRRYSEAPSASSEMTCRPVAQKGREVVGQLRMLESEFDRRLEVAELAAAIVAPPFETVCDHGFLEEQPGD